jgi:hypothetical protein
VLFAVTTAPSLVLLGGITLVDAVLLWMGKLGDDDDDAGGTLATGVLP